MIDYIKNHLQLFVTIACLIAIIVIVNMLEKPKPVIDDSAIRNNEITAIRNALDEERKQREENIKALNIKLSEIEKMKNDELVVVEQKKTNTTKMLVQEFDTDPTGVANKIGSLTGLKVVSAEQFK